LTPYVQNFVASRVNSKNVLLMIFSPAYVEVLIVEEHNKCYRRHRVSKLVFIEDRMRVVIVDEHSIMCSIKPDRGSQVYIEKHAANVVHYGQVESLYLIERIIFRLHHD